MERAASPTKYVAFTGISLMRVPLIQGYIVPCMLAYQRHNTVAPIMELKDLLGQFGLSGLVNSQKCTATIQGVKDGYQSVCAWRGTAIFSDSWQESIA